ncbi:MAG: HAD-IC family P-type ATPase, partial [Oscillospiraceae bacterium]|nr:HAD-IC family P-type ATPase [Oscillospiraceae bacterium]
MGKTLAKTYKHELKKEHKVSPRKQSRKQSQKQPRKKISFAGGRDFGAFAAITRFQPILLILAAVALAVLFFVPLSGWLRPVAFAIPLLLASVQILPDCAAKLRSGSFLNGELITVLATVLLFALGLYPESVLLLLLDALVHWAERFVSEKGKRELDEILDILPAYAQLITEDGIARVSPEELIPGDVILVSAGERIPVDGTIVEGITTVDTAAISGQRSPWAVNEGYRVYSGSMNLTSDIKVRVTRRFEQSTVRNVVRVAQDAEGFPSGQEYSSRRLSIFWMLGMLALSLVIAIVLPAFRGTWAEQLRRGAMLLILARPLLDAYGIPIAYRKGLVLSAKMGVFSKGEDCYESLARAETMIFDKTGTITEGRYTVTDVFPTRMSEQQLLTIAATAESFSRHPIAAALREAAGKIDSRVLKALKVKEIPGRGVTALVGDKTIYVGNAALLEERGIKCSIPARPGTAIHVAVDKRYCGHILVADKVRKRAFDALEGLRVNGVEKLVLLTGDVLSVARPLASRLNFDMLRAELKPEGKAK